MNVVLIPYLGTEQSKTFEFIEKVKNKLKTIFLNLNEKFKLKTN
jgi:hypothetical protein